MPDDDPSPEPIEMQKLPSKGFLTQRTSARHSGEEESEVKRRDTINNLLASKRLDDDEDAGFDAKDQKLPDDT